MDRKKTQNKSVMEQIKELPDVDRILKNKDAVDRLPEKKEMTETQWYHSQLGNYGE